MLHKRNNFVITLTVLLALVGGSRPAKALLLAQADGNTPTLTQTNPDLRGSGTANPDLEGSGKVNPDLESSGTANLNVDGSGKVNPEFQDSGVVNRDLKGSGEVNSDLDGSGTANPNVNVADTEAQGDANATKKGNWWWWIPLIVGLPLLGLLGISSLKRGKSDREPAIANTPLPNDPQGGSVAFDPDIDGISPRDGATTGDLGTTSNLDGAAIATGGAALAGGAAATNRIGDRNNKDIEKVDTDRLELENVVAQPETDIDNIIVEIPSNPVNEFTDQETELQTTEQQIRLVDDLNDSSGLLDNVSASGAALGGSAAAASGFFSDREDSVEETTESVIEDNDITYAQSGYVDDRLGRSQVDEPDYPEATAEENTAFETENAREFRGDYVLREEIPIEEINSEIEDDDTTAIGDANWVDSTTSEWNAPDNTVLDSIDNTPTEVELSEDEDGIFEQTSGFANDATRTGGVAASGFFTNRDEQPTEVDSEDINWVDDTTSEWDAPDNTVLDSIDNTPTTEVELSEDEDGIFEQTSGFANDATRTGGVAASGFFTNRDEQPTEVDSEDINWVDDTTSEWDAPDNTVLDSVDNTATTEADLEMEDSDFILDTRINNDFETNIIADAEVTSDETDYSLDDFTNSGDISLDEITLDDADSSLSASSDEFSLDETTNSGDISVEEITFDDADNSVNASLDEFSLDETTDSRDISLDEMSFDDADSSLSASSDEFAFDETTNSGDISVEEITFDDADNSVNASLDEFSLDETTDSRDISLDEMSFDDADSSLSASSDEFAFDETTNSGDISVEEITFDDADNLVSASLDEFSLDETTNSGDISLDEITFEDTDNLVNASLDEFSLDETTDSKDISLDEIAFEDTDNLVNASLDEFSLDETTGSRDISLDEITFEDTDSSVNASPDEFTFDDSNNSTEISLDEITFDDADSSIDDLINSIGTDTFNQKVDLDELSFDENLERKENSPSDLLSGKTAGITDIADEKSDDMDNISTWLDGLETPDQNTEHISEWLENLNVDSTNADSEKGDSDKTPRLNKEDEDISFQFLEDLLDRDPNINQDDK